jgi:hypothetical protein
MSAKGRKWDTRTILYVLVIFLIVVAVIYVVTLPPDDSEPVLSVQTVLANVDSGIYENKIITVEGIYHESVDGPSLRTPTNDANPSLYDYIPLDLENLINVTLIVDSKYHVTGELETVTTTGRIVLVATIVEPK